jgi:hypothetical protein
MVRNEADIIEAFVRHNLAFLDRIVIVDHGSFDGTSEILAALAAEGLPIALARDDRVAFFQPEVMTRVVRDLCRADADFVFVLDADEFVRARSRATLHDVLRRVPQNMHALVPWLTYAPAFETDANEDMLAALRNARRLRDTREPLHKVIVARHFASTPAAFVAVGNHRVYASDDAGGQSDPHARIPEQAIGLAHVPIRSADQITAKIAIGWLAHLAARRGNPSLAFHWGEHYTALANGGRFSPEDLLNMAANYSRPREQWLAVDGSAWSAEPFLSDVRLRYSGLRRGDAFSNVLRFAERLARGDQGDEGAANASSRA